MTAFTTGRTKPRRARRLDRMAAKDERLGRGSAADRAFFERNPDRNYGARLATAYEVAALEMMSEPPAAPPGELFLWMLVHQIAPGFRMRLFAFGGAPVGANANIDEEKARDLFVAADSQFAAEVAS
jgi:hypothetical protein